MKTDVSKDASQNSVEEREKVWELVNEIYESLEGLFNRRVVIDEGWRRWGWGWCWGRVRVEEEEGRDFAVL